MDVTLALLADGANVSQDGKLNILGVFNALGAATFPAMHPQMYLVLRFEATRAEEGKTKNIEIQLSDTDGNKLFTIGAQIVVPRGNPGQPIRMNHILGMNNVRFEKPGDYAFNVLVADDQKASIDLKLFETKAPEGARPPAEPTS